MGFAVFFCFFAFFLQSISEEMMVSFKSLGFSRVQRNRNMTDPLRNDDPGTTFFSSIIVRCVEKKSIK